MGTLFIYRTLARIILESVTPIKVGSGEKDITTDATVALDVNGLPFIPGSSIAGAIRHSLPKDLVENEFGSSSNHTGSRILFSDGNLVYENGQVVDGILAEKTDYLHLFDDLPIRQHVRIGYRGAAERGGKFDETVVYAGVRFCFEMELLSGTDCRRTMEHILSVLLSSCFRLGGGSRKGFGRVKVIDAKIAALNLTNEDELRLYLNKSACLNSQWQGWKPFTLSQTDNDEQWITRSITLKPDDFFLFASGSGDDDADITPTYERKVVWNNDIPIYKDLYCLIPASSIKGSLAHRVAFHYNRLNYFFADSELDVKNLIGQNNNVVRELFGDTTKRGNVFISDLFVKTESKLFNHNSIDDFTGGTLDGHLFTEKVSFGKSVSLSFDISVNEKAFSQDSIRKAFNCAITDLIEGRLPLGNGTNKGHGVFIGTISGLF